MRAADYRELKLPDLHQRADELRREIFKLRLRMAQEPASALKEWRQSRRDLARVLTVIREQEKAS